MITVKNLTKRYGDFVAVDNLSFTIEDGHVYGFLGPNGAGKSTTLNMITGCLSQTSGSVTIDGYDNYEQAKEAKKCIGYLPEIPPLYIDQTPNEYLKFVAQAKKVKKEDLQAEIDRVVGEAHIENVRNKLIRHLSKGYRQRVGIAQALIGSPKVIILDEPTVGLDPMQIIEIRDLVRELGKKHTVIISSHILSEIQAICEQVIIIYKGKLVAFDRPENLGRALAPNTTITMVAEGTEEEARELLKSVDHIVDCTIKEENGMSNIRLSVDVEDPTTLLRTLSLTFAKADKAVLQMNTEKATLEDIFVELTVGDQKIQKEGTK